MKEGRLGVGETRRIEQQVKDKLREIQNGARYRYKAKRPEDLADELEELLKRSNLARPPALSTEQYQATAHVWDVLGSEDLSEVNAAAEEALKRMAESRNNSRILSMQESDISKAK